MVVKLIIGLLLYVVTISMLITIVALGMGYTVDNSSGCTYTDTSMDCSGMMNYNPPSTNTMIQSLPIIGNVTASALDSAAYVGTIVSAFAAVLFWSLPEAIFPLWANVLLIKIPLIGLVIAFVDVILP